MTDQGSNVLSPEPAQEDAGEQAFTDPHRPRPRFRFVAPSGWLNDPNGLVQWKGRFHMHRPKARKRPVQGSVG